jgi:DNA polymerase-3 subunit beta
VRAARFVDERNAQQTLTVAQGEFRRLIDKTHFAMAQQDVRYYLNGMLLETEDTAARAIAIDASASQAPEGLLGSSGEASSITALT